MGGTTGRIPSQGSSDANNMHRDEEFNVKYKENNFNIYRFLNNHPGGVNYVEPFREKDVSKRMDDTHHSKAAYYLLKEYNTPDKNGNCSEDHPNDLEKLVDWNKPMLSQVGYLGVKYNEWVTSPVDRKLRLFENPILESLTITPWYVVPLVWLPIISYLIIYGFEKYVTITKDPSPFLPVFLNIGAGVFLWTLVEYSLHRWVFHLEPSGSSKTIIYLHFAIHGLHHKVPFDPGRLVFPPFPAAILTLLFYKLLSCFVPESSIILVLAGGILGYVTYDMIHFYLHYGAPTEGGYFYHLKRYHNQHHFAHHDSGFGISSIFWDKLFGTAIKLRKLKLGIRW